MSPRSKDLNLQMRKDTLDKITKAGLAVFTEYGYHGATIKKITEVTGLSYGLVYHYFASKEDVFSHLVNLALDKMQLIFNGALDAEGTAWKKLTILSNAFLNKSLTEDTDTFLFFNLMLQALIQSKNIPSLKEDIDRKSQTVFKRMMETVIEAQAAGDAVSGNPAALTTAYMSLVQGLYTYQSRADLENITPDILLNILRK